MSASAFSTLVFTREDGVAHIALNRPQVLNAYNMQMRDDFSEALATLELDSDIRVLLITGRGRAFCAGADLTEFGSAPSQVAARQARWERDVWGRLLGLRQPVVVAVHGYCIGSGLEIMLLGDLRIAASDTVFSLPEAHLGMIPAAGGTQTLPRNAGQSAALDLLLTGRRFDAEEARRLGLVTRLVSSDGLAEAAREAAGKLAAGDPDRTAAAKTAIREGMDLELGQALDLEARLAALALG